MFRYWIDCHQYQDYLMVWWVWAKDTVLHLGGKFDEAVNDSTQPPDTVMRIRIENIVKAYLGFMIDNNQ